MVHPLVEQLRFARSEFWRGLRGLSEEDARRRVAPMNSISWNVGHLAWQEQRYWLRYGAGLTPVPLPELDTTYRYGAPASIPSLAEVRSAWETITTAADPWLETVDEATLLRTVTLDSSPISVVTIGSLMLRTTYHYWYHTGENAAIRQVLGHTDLPDFVGDIDGEAPYRPA